MNSLQFQVWGAWFGLLSRQFSVNFLVTIGIKYMKQVAGVSLTSAGQMMGVHIGISAIWIMVSASLSDFVRRGMMTTVQVFSIFYSILTSALTLRIAGVWKFSDSFILESI